MSLALYRRYRPETFAEVIGQEHVTVPLQQALANDRVTHAYLFSGPRGCGKTTSARILARALNCEQGPAPEPCGKCGSCHDLARDGAGSLDVVEIDAASHGGVDDARDLRDRAFFSPASSRFKIYIIDEAHMVSREGFNALLKVVEEPPPHLKFIFATTEPDKVLGTIRSRTHHYPFRLVPQRTLTAYLEQICRSEGVDVGPGVLPMVVRAGAGSVRDALSVLDQLIGGAGPEGVTHSYAATLLGYTDAALLDDVVDALAAGDGATVFGMVDRVVESGTDPRRFVADLLERLRDLIILQAVPEAAARGLLHAPEDQVARMQAQAGHFGPAELARAAEVVNAGLTEMRGATAPRLQLELICARVLLPGADGDAERAMGARLDRLERRFAIGGAPPAAPPAAPAAAPPDAGPRAPAPPAPAPTVPEAPVPAPPAPGPADGLDVHAVRRMWPDILAEVKNRRRVAWMILLERVNVLGIDDGRLTLGFSDAGAFKAFTGGKGSGHDEVLRQVIIDLLGVDWRIEAVLDPGARTPTGGGRTPASAQQPQPQSQSRTPTAPGVQPTAAAPADRVDDVPSADDADAEDAGLTGAELVAKQLGGRVIGEIGAD
ncbi:MAG: DNA polymerase III subunit gamma and tau [Actinomycetia bacterium]|nr:DNA polymerase III subunit gamma and tau [Actinomycetes bacterium]